MKVQKNNKKDKSKNITVTYSKWPGNGTGIGRIIEWDNGEGVDIFLENQNVELTHCEASAIIALIGLLYSHV